MNGKFDEKDWVGYRGKNAVVIRPTEKRNKRNSRIWICKCDCGKEFEYEAERMYRLNSCGCKIRTSYSDVFEELQGETWKEITECPGYYVSDAGRIMSVNYLGHGKKMVLKQSTDQKGYKRVCMYPRNGNRKTYKVHRIVADAFIDHDPSKLEVNHIDGNKANNSVENLEWVTSHENILHAYANGLKANNVEFARKLGKSMAHVLRENVEKKKIRVIAENLVTGVKAEYGSISEAGRQLGIYQANISAAIKNNRPVKGFMFHKV